MSDPVIDRIDAIHLEGLRHHAVAMQRETASVSHYAKAVMFKRDFETMAEDELLRAKTALEAALIAVTSAIMEYQGKRPEFKQAAE